MATLEDVKKFFETSKDNQEVAGYLAELKKVTPEETTAFLETEDGKKILQPRLDKYFTKGLETWKEKNLSKIIDEELAKRNPPETPEAKKLRELEQKLNATERARLMEVQRNKAISHATQKGLPIALVDLVISEDDSVLNSNLSLLETAWAEQLEAKVAERFKDGGRAPAGQQVGPTDIDAQIAAAEAAKDFKTARNLKLKKLAEIAAKTK